MPIATQTEIQELIAKSYGDRAVNKDETAITAKFYVVMRDARGRGLSWERITELFKLADTAMDELGY